MDRRVGLVNQANRWFRLAIEFQDYAYRHGTLSHSNPLEYPDEVFQAYRGYTRCMQMYDALWVQISRTTPRAPYPTESKRRRRRPYAYQVAQAKEDMKFIDAMAIPVLLLVTWICFFGCLDFLSFLLSALA